MRFFYLLVKKKTSRRDKNSKYSYEMILIISLLLTNINLNLIVCISKKKTWSYTKQSIDWNNNWFQSHFFPLGRKRLQLTNFDNSIDAFAHVFYANRNAKRYNNWWKDKKGRVNTQTYWQKKYIKKGPGPE